MRPLGPGPGGRAGFGKLADLSAENLRLAGVIEEEFERLPPDDDIT